ncbi:MAG: hypothetical protein CVT87_07675, partial [Alphaproteobacteria bacterium HGW-Alphaproteobacteria-9]
FLEDYNNVLKDLNGWLSLAARAQSEPDRLDRYLAVPQVVAAITPEDLHQAARQWLTPDGAVELLVVPAAE